jgi:hypothetical protein
MRNNIGNEYYKGLMPRIKDDFGSFSVVFNDKFCLRFGKTKTQNILDEIKVRIELLIPELPYIGGKKNNFYSEALISSAFYLPMFLVLEREGYSIRDLARVRLEILEFMSKSLSPRERNPDSSSFFSKDRDEVRKQNAKKSQLRRYPEDWVFEFVEGNDHDFDFGVDYIECGIFKYYEKLGVERFAPICCLCDYPNFHRLGIGFKRTQTIACGASSCDFRFIRDYDTPKGWPPESLEENLIL